MRSSIGVVVNNGHDKKKLTKMVWGCDEAKGNKISKSGDKNER